MKCHNNVIGCIRVDNFNEYELVAALVTLFGKKYFFVVIDLTLIRYVPLKWHAR